MNVLVTGAGGYTGKGLTQILAARHRVRGLDIVARPTACPEFQVGDLADLAVCERAVAGMEALVLCHMAPNPHGYQTPAPAFDINVKGTANLYHAAQAAGIRRVVLISSCGVLDPNTPAPRDAQIGVGPYRYGSGYYVLTKIIQEGLALYFFKAAQIATAVLRPSWIVYDGELVTKYGEKLERYYTSLIDPRDIGAAALAALALPDLGLEAFNIGQDDYMDIDATATRTRLQWRAQFRFASLPRVAD